jgi:hypothetical protein
MANILVTPERLREVVKTWIEETDIQNVAEVFNQNFDEEIWYNPEVGMFEMPESEAKNLGLDL